MTVRYFIFLSLLILGGLLAAACGEEPKTPVISTVESDGDTDADTDGDADSDSDADADPDARFVGNTCAAATECGGNLHCVDGVCCRDLCTAECASCAVPGYEGECTALEAGTVCRAAASACDEEETCDGTYKTCPTDQMKPLGALCGDEIDNDCDDPDTCDIDGICQPNFAPAGGACTDPGGFCKVNPLCDGAGLCTSAVNKPDGETCGSTELTECDTPDNCLAGVCEPNYVEWGTPCGDVTTMTWCNFADFCDGLGTCLDNILEAGTLCGDTDDDECNKPDQCDDAGNCDAMLMPDETACGDSSNSDCDKPDSCLAGTCAANIIPDGTVCNDGESTVVYRCSDTDCAATPQMQVAGWACTTGECSEVLTPEWENVGDPCTVSQVCVTDAGTYAQCVNCDQPGLNECIGTVATGYNPDGVCSIAGGTAECAYEPMAEDCTLRTDGNINCVQGACTSYTCDPGEFDNEYTWDTGEDDWTVGAAWSSTNSYPWTNGNWQNNYWEYAHADVTDIEDTYLLSPTYELYACDHGEVTFYFTGVYQRSCSEKAEIRLECGSGDDWVTIWSQEQGSSYVSPVQTDQEEDLVVVDIADCLNVAATRFRFSVHNSCVDVQSLWIDHFTMTAAQTVTADTEAVDTAATDTAARDTSATDTSVTDTASGALSTDTSK